MDAKFAALERFEDMDDSISSISTVSDDSDLDSGYENTNWISKLPSLSEVKEDDYEVTPKITWDELYVADSEPAGNNSTPSSSQENLNNEMLSRDDWERILKREKVDLSRNRKIIENKSENSTGTLKENTLKTSDVQTWVDRGAIPKHLTRTAASHESAMKGSNTRTSRAKQLKEKSNAPKEVNQVKDSKERSKSWLTNLFVGKNYSKPSNSSRSVEVCEVPNRVVDVPDGNLIIIPEIEEIKIDENLVSRSFDDGCEFEKAEECNEEISFESNEYESFRNERGGNEIVSAEKELVDSVLGKSDTEDAKNFTNESRNSLENWGSSFVSTARITDNTSKKHKYNESEEILDRGETTLPASPPLLDTPCIDNNLPNCQEDFSEKDLKIDEEFGLFQNELLNNEVIPILEASKASQQVRQYEVIDETIQINVALPDSQSNDSKETSSTPDFINVSTESCAKANETELLLSGENHNMFQGNVKLAFDLETSYKDSSNN